MGSSLIELAHLKVPTDSSFLRLSLSINVYALAAPTTDVVAGFGAAYFVTGACVVAGAAVYYLPQTSLCCGQWSRW